MTRLRERQLAAAAFLVAVLVLVAGLALGWWAQRG